MAENKKPRFFYGYIVIVTSFLIILMMWGTAYSFGVFFKPLLAEFGWTRAMTSGAYSLCLLLNGFLGIGTGRLTDRFGPRVVITGCGLFLGLGCLLVSQVSALWQLYLFYGVMMGVGLSGSLVPIRATVARWFVKRRGTMTGIAVSGLGMGTLIVPPIANWLISAYDWRTSYIVVGIAVSVLVISAAQFMKRDPSQIGQLPYGVNEVKGDNLNLAAADFSLRQAMQTRQLWLLCTALFFFGGSLQMIMVHVVPHATDLKLSTASAVIILAVIGGLSTGGRVIMGIAGDRIGNKLAFIMSFGLMSAALFWLLAAKELWMLYLFAVLFSFGYGGIAVLISPVVAEQFGLNSLGTILGIIFFICAIGETIGPVVAGYIFDMTGSYQLGFLVTAILSFIGLILVSILRPTSGQGERSAPERSTGLY